MPTRFLRPPVTSAPCRLDHPPLRSMSPWQLATLMHSRVGTGLHTRHHGRHKGLAICGVHELSRESAAMGRQRTWEPPGYPRGGIKPAWVTELGHHFLHLTH